MTGRGGQQASVKYLGGITEGRPNRIVAGVCCRPPDQDEEMDAVLLEQCDRIAKQPDLVVMDDFNPSHVLGDKLQSVHSHTNFCLADNFLHQIVEEAMRGLALFD